MTIKRKASGRKGDYAETIWTDEGNIVAQGEATAGRKRGHGLLYVSSLDKP